MLGRLSAVGLVLLAVLLAGGAMASGAGDPSEKLRATIVDEDKQKRLRLESYCYGGSGGPSGCGIYLGARGPDVRIENDVTERFAVGAPAKRIVGFLLKRRKNGELGRRERSNGQLVPGSKGRRWTAGFPDAGRRWDVFRLRVFYRESTAPKVNGAAVEEAEFVARRR